MNRMNLTSEELRFSAAMQRFLRHGRRFLQRGRRVNLTCGQILDIMMDIGYVHEPKGDFLEYVCQFQTALHEYKRKEKRVRPEWREVLAVAKSLGWKLQNKTRSKIIHAKEVESSEA